MFLRTCRRVCLSSPDFFLPPFLPFAEILFSSLTRHSYIVSTKDQKPQTKSEDDQSLPTLSSIKPKIREQQEKQQQSQQQRQSDDPNAALAAADNSGKSPQELEEEAGQEAAFNPETGEINWDCPCLGGMAHGPCGEEFKAAFSCFVYSNEEPKGIDCIEKFK